jgi:hypothetical protein
MKFIYFICWFQLVCFCFLWLIWGEDNLDYDDREVHEFTVWTVVYIGLSLMVVNLDI